MKRPTSVLAVVYFVTMTVAVTFPGIGFVNSADPYILGIPFVMAWVLAWVAGSLVVFYLLYRGERK